jgi:hypothetical protein
MANLKLTLFGKSVVSCKSVYKIKTWTNGSVNCYKAHMVTNNFTQEYSIDYKETFSPIARLTAVRSLLVVVVVHH